MSGSLWEAPDQVLLSKLGAIQPVGDSRGIHFAPLENFDVIHEVLQTVVAGFWLAAYTSLLRKLHRDKSALGLSLQTLFALLLSESINLALILLSRFEFSVSLRTVQVAACTITCLLSLVAYLTVARNYATTYESDRDSFGAHPLNICCLKRKRPARTLQLCLGFRIHWLTLYIVCAILAALLQYFRKHEFPTWFGYLECFNDSVTALALLPQLHMFWTNRQRRVNRLLGRFVLCLLMAKVTALIYWTSDVWFHNTYKAGRGIHIVTELLHIAILLEFTYYYIVSRRKKLQDICLPV